MGRLKMIFSVAVLLVLMPTLSGAGPLADYGDAPDNGTSFPSLFNTTNSRVVGRRGPYHLDVSMEWLGPWPMSTTTMEDDALLIDQDFDDAFVACYVRATSIPRLAWVQVQLSIAPGSEMIPRFLNILVDHNRDLEWRETGLPLPEWVVVNQPIQSIPMAGYYFVPFLQPAPMFGQILPMDSTWIRVTLTQTPIDPFVFSGVGGWDGSGPDGGFLFGETEDWIVMPIPVDVPPPESIPSDPDSIIIPPPPPDSTKTAIIWGFGRPHTVKVPFPGSSGGQICATNKGDHPVHVELALWLPKWEENYARPTYPDAESTMIDPGATVCWNYTVQWSEKPPFKGWKEPWDFILFTDPADDTIIIDQLYEFEYPGDLITWTDPDGPFETVCRTDLVFDVWASHPDPDSVIELWADSLPAGASFSPVGGSNMVSSQFSWTPGYCDAGVHHAVFKAATATDTVTENVGVYVVKLDRVPVIVGLPDWITFPVSDTLNIHVTAVDDDVVDCGDDMMLLNYVMDPVPTASPTFVDSGNGAGWFRWIPDPSDTAAFTAKFFVRDLYYWGSGEFIAITATQTGIHRASGTLRPPQFTLKHNSPNPFTSATAIALIVDDEFLGSGEFAILKIHDVLGRHVKTLWTGRGPAVVTWDGRLDDGTKATSGVYFYTLSTRSKILTKKMLLLR